MRRKLPLSAASGLAAVIGLVGKQIPTMIDKAYRHLNRADDRRRRRRVRA